MPTHPLHSELVDRLVDSYLADQTTQHLDSAFLPSRARVIEAVELLRRLVFPGFFDEQRLTSDSVHAHAAALLEQVGAVLREQVRQALRHADNKASGKRDDDRDNHELDLRAGHLTEDFLRRLPEVRRLLGLDIRAGYDGDPAAASTDEIVFCYPGLDAIFLHRIAHELHKLRVPLLPRIISEYAHNETGIDIHPGAEIGESFFIDHGTGVVIGETCVIGNRVKLYQGVTLGALSTKGGQSWRGHRRHPTLEDDVTIYGGAIILGGATVIGRGATIGGSVFLTQSVPPGYTVSMKAPELKMSARRERSTPATAHAPLDGLDFVI